jgi:hypothetical protein
MLHMAFMLAAKGSVAATTATLASVTTPSGTAGVRRSRVLPPTMVDGRVPVGQRVISSLTGEGGEVVDVWGDGHYLIRFDGFHSPTRIPRHQVEPYADPVARFVYAIPPTPPAAENYSSGFTWALIGIGLLILAFMTVWYASASAGI